MQWIRVDPDPKRWIYVYSTGNLTYPIKSRVKIWKFDDRCTGVGFDLGSMSAIAAASFGAAYSFAITILFEIEPDLLQIETTVSKTWMTLSLISNQGQSLWNLCGKIYILIREDTRFETFFSVGLGGSSVRQLKGSRQDSPTYSFMPKKSLFLKLPVSSKLHMYVSLVYQDLLAKKVSIVLNLKHDY